KLVPVVNTSCWVVRGEVHAQCARLGIPDAGGAQGYCFQSRARQCEVPWVIRIRWTWNTGACRDVDISTAQVLNLVEWVVFKATWANYRDVHCVEVEAASIKERQTHQGLRTWNSSR